MHQISPKTWQVIAGLLALSTVLKLYHLTAPALDWQSWNQITTLANARYIYHDGWSAFWVPRVDRFEGLDLNSNRTFGEFPILHVLMAAGYWVIGGEAEWVGRIWNIALSLLGGVYLVRLGRRDLTGLGLTLAVGIYALSSSNLYFHRTLKTDIGFLVFTIVGLYHFVTWLDARRARDALLAGAGIGLAALFKPYALYMGAAFLYLLLRRDGRRGLVRPWSLAIATLCLVPVMAWVYYGTTLLTGASAEGRNLMTGAGLMGPVSILLQPGYYVALLNLWVGWIPTPLVGFAGMLAVGLGIRQAVRRPKTAVAPAVPFHWPDWLTAWWIGILVYVAVIRHGNYQHDYYQIPTLAPVAVTAALGLEWLWRWLSRPVLRFKTVWQGAFITALILSAALAIFEARNKTNLDWDPYFAGKAVERVRKPNEYTIVSDTGGTRHQQALYYTGGKGWLLPRGTKDFAELKPYTDLGARYLLVSLSDEDWKNRRYPLPLVETLLQAQRIELVEESTREMDRYGRPRHWAVYRFRT